MGTNATSREVRMFERRRRKHDKFVEPKGERPTREKRARPETQEIKPKREPVPAAEPQPTPRKNVTDPILVDEHHEGDRHRVLYKNEELWGEFNFRDTILQQLDRYFFYLKRMRQRDREAYDLYRQVGATIVPYLANGSWKRTQDRDIPRPEETKGPLAPLPAWFNHKRPSFGCIAYGSDPETEIAEHRRVVKDKDFWVPKFIYYRKLAVPPWTVQPINDDGDVYMLTFWWDRPGSTRYGSQQDVPIFVPRDGKNLVALKVLDTHYATIGGYARQYAGMQKHGGSKRKPFSLPVRQWKIPSSYSEWADDFDEEVHHFLCRQFIDAVNLIENARLVSTVRVAVSKNQMTATFTVNIHRTAYFFQDRDIEVTKNGTRRQVFHAVRPHTRKNGSAVKMYFKGEREFTWAGYKVRITVPGLDDLDIGDIDIGGIDADTQPVPDGIDNAKLGHMLSQWMDQGKGGIR